MIKTKRTGARLILYVLGLFLITLGISLAIRTDLGVSPISAVPYALTRITGVNIGITTVVFQSLLVGLEALLLRREFRLKMLLQIPAGALFGYLVNFSSWLIAGIPMPTALVPRLVLALVSPVITGLGLFFYIPADVITLSPDAAMTAIAKVAKIPASRAKVLLDLSSVALALAACLVMMGEMGAVGAGAVISALLVGPCYGFYDKRFGTRRDRLLA